MMQARAPELVLIHGWGLGSFAWEAAMPALAARRFKVHRVSLPGYDAPTESVGEQTAAQTFLQTARRFAETLPEGSILCGWSLGGLLALQTALLAPQRFKALILVGGTPCFAQRADWPHAQPPALLDTFSAAVAVAGDARATLQRFVALLNQGDTQARTTGRALNRQLADIQVPDPDTLLAGLGWLREVDLRHQIDALSLPTLLVHGENDPLMPLAAARWLAVELPNAQLAIIPGAAHAPFLHDPEGFASLTGDYCHAFAPDQATRS
jgi:pimeloyl-[acyl-carrier protein] methyl ester esterase